MTNPNESVQPDLDAGSIPADSILYVVNDASDIRDVRVDVYKLIRWTEHNWFVMCRGSEKKIRKSRLTFINHDVLVEYLQKRKRQEFETAQRRLLALTEQVEVPIYNVPHERYAIPTEGLKL